MHDPVTSPVAPLEQPADATPREGTRLRDVILLSLAVTAAAALVALVPAVFLDARWSYVFVMVRWIVVFVLLALPLAYQVATRFGLRMSLPWAIRTPATALVLTVEGIAYDIISAHLRG